MEEIRKENILKMNFGSNKLFVFYEDLVVECYHMQLDHGGLYNSKIGIYCNQDYDCVNITLLGKNVLPPPLCNFTIKNQQVCNGIDCVQNKVKW